MELIENLEEKKVAERLIKPNKKLQQDSINLTPTTRNNWDRNAVKRLPKHTIVRASKLAKFHIAIIVVAVLGIVSYVFQSMLNIPLPIILAILTLGALLFYLVLDKLLNSSRLFTLSDEGILLENGETISWKNANTYFSTHRKKQKLIVKTSEGLEKEIKIDQINKKREDLGNLIELYKLKFKFLNKHSA